MKDLYLFYNNTFYSIRFLNDFLQYHLRSRIGCNKFTPFLNNQQIITRAGQNINNIINLNACVINTQQVNSYLLGSGLNNISCNVFIPADTFGPNIYLDIWAKIKYSKKFAGVLAMWFLLLLNPLNLYFKNLIYLRNKLLSLTYYIRKKSIICDSNDKVFRCLLNCNIYVFYLAKMAAAFDRKCLIKITSNHGKLCSQIYTLQLEYKNYVIYIRDLLKFYTIYIAYIEKINDQRHYSSLYLSTKNNNN